MHQMHSRSCRKGASALLYVISDLHGCYDKYRMMLEKINFSEYDKLYILGDIIDRGEEGIHILVDMMGRPNITGLLGNHEYIALEVLNSYLSGAFTPHSEQLYWDWLKMGGEPTFRSFIHLPKEEQEATLGYISPLSSCKEVILNARRFHLSHSVPAKDRLLNDRALNTRDFLFDIPEYNKTYFEDKYVVTGHIPTFHISSDCDGRILKKNNHIAIDCGAVFGGFLGCFCLDSFEEYYI